MLLSLVTTALVRKLALRTGLVDKPDVHRKLHTKITPLGGGIAILVSTAISTGILIVADTTWRTLLTDIRHQIIGLLIASTVIVAIGVLDDFKGLRGRQKLAGQILAAGILIWCGLSIRSIQIFETVINLGYLSIPFTTFWLLGAMNSINLLDGIDGLTVTLGIIISGTIALMAVLTGHLAVGMIALIFTASLFGFLKFNFPPATMFLGDAGSMLIGLVVGALAIQASLKSPGTVLLAAPMAVLIIPILDTGAAIVRRKLTGRSIYSTDRGHLHHRLLQLFGSHKALGLVALCCLFMSAAALLSIYLRNDLIAMLSGIALVLVFVATRIFGHSELLLLAIRLRSFSRSLFSPPGSSSSSIEENSIRLQGDRQWDLLWEGLTEWADKLSLQHILLDVNAPMLHESYHASWKRSSQSNHEKHWKLDLPLIISEQPVGYLKIVGERGTTSVSQDIERLLSLLEPFEEHLLHLTTPMPEEAPMPEKAPISEENRDEASKTTTHDITTPEVVSPL